MSPEAKQSYTICPSPLPFLFTMAWVLPLYDSKLSRFLCFFHTDFPGLCFGSTTFKFYTEETTWNLELFCGQSTCMKNATGLFEKVEDCGPAPKPNDQCIPEFAAPGTAYPDCCPKYRCRPGVTLEYPTPEEIKALAEKARKEQAAAREQALQGTAAAEQPAAQA